MTRFHLQRQSLDLHAERKVAVEVLQHAAGGVVPPVQERGAERVGEEEGEQGVRGVVERHEHPEAGLAQHARAGHLHSHLMHQLSWTRVAI